MIGIIYFKYPDVNIVLLYGYLFFGVGWFLRGIFFMQELYFSESVKLPLKVMKIYMLIILVIYVICFFLKVNFESIQLIIGIVTILFWSYFLFLSKKINFFL